jgi:hypothetical protein
MGGMVGAAHRNRVAIRAKAGDLVKGQIRPVAITR